MMYNTITLNDKFIRCDKYRSEPNVDATRNLFRMSILSQFYYYGRIQFLPAEILLRVSVPSVIAEQTVTNIKMREICAKFCGVKNN
jgi:hypothetical protein